ncbi:MAG: prolipoprotein diacylglyceryl transferase [Pirellulales bacterium]|nr:prolipoprotein diacylglyceryl transferase [Pirellulales bacterium]
MFDTVLKIPQEIAGFPVFGVGLVLAAWCLFGLILLVSVARRHGFGNELLSYLPLLVLVAAAVIWFLPKLCHDGSLPIRGYGVMLLIAVVSGTTLLAWRAKRVGLDPDTMVSLVLWMFVPGIIGARLFYVIEYWSSFQRPTVGETVGAILNFSEGGLVLFGSFIAGMLGMLFFVRKKRLPLLAIGDLLAPSMMLGLALGRIGCLAHGCCFGGPCDLPWAVTFPQGSPVYEQQLARGQLWGFSLDVDPTAPPVVASVDADGDAARIGLRPGDRLVRINGQAVRNAGEVSWHLQSAASRGTTIRLETDRGRLAALATLPRPPRSLPVHPTQIYSSINALLICLLLLAYAPFRRRDGEVFALMLTVYPITRFLLEVIRTDEGSSLRTGLTISQNISLLILLLIVGLWAFVLKQPRGAALAARPES